MNKKPENQPSEETTCTPEISPDHQESETTPNQETIEIPDPTPVRRSYS